MICEEKYKAYYSSKKKIAFHRETEKSRVFVFTRKMFLRKTVFFMGTQKFWWWEKKKKCAFAFTRKFLRSPQKLLQGKKGVKNMFLWWKKSSEESISRQNGTILVMENMRLDFKAFTIICKLLCSPEKLCKRSGDGEKYEMGEKKCPPKKAKALKCLFSSMFLF